jgi:RNA polymerase sigma-70 factor, ECF subfamily
MDREATFREVFDDLHERVFAICRHLTGSRAEAEDAVQETFIAVHRALPAFRGESKVSTWVYRIAVNTAVGVKSRRKRRQEGPIDDAAHLTDNAPAPDEIAIAREAATKLERALDELNAEHRTVLSLFAVDGLRHEEVAEVLGVPVGTVWSRLHAARKRVAAAMAYNARH